MSTDTKRSFAPALAVLTSLFFMFGFVTCFSGQLVPYLQGLFKLSNFQSNLVNSAFFIAFVVTSVPSSILVKRLGYKMGCVVGLAICAVGALLYYPSGSMQSFPLFMAATFVVATGVTVMQVAANPFVTLLGDPDGASARLNMTQAFNSLGTYVAPLLAGALLLADIDKKTPVEQAAVVQMPYVILGGLLIALAVVFSMFKLPDPQKQESSSGADAAAADDFEKLHTSAWAYRHLLLGVFGIFAYVGTEVAIGSNIVAFLKDPGFGGLTKEAAAKWAAIYWGGAMIGRFFGALMLTKGLDATKKHGFAALAAAFAFVVGYVALQDTTSAAVFFGCAVANYGALQLGQNNPNRSLGVFAVVAAALALAPMVVPGQAAVVAICSIGLFNSIMFPTIFSLGVAKLGKHTPQGSGALVMGIVGGAVIPPLWGTVADMTGTVTIPFVVCALCYAYIAFYAFVGSIPEAAKGAATPAPAA
jgi:MFS transporter, FHS family, L-fucose permease